MEKPLIFITNDDGVNALGLRHLVRVARRFGRVLVVAPEHHQSGMSHAVTMFTPLFLRKVRDEEDLTVYSCSGTPVDCVKMAFDHLMADERPVLALSGINHGSNAAINVLYSGTMGAAIEASFYGCYSLGISLTDHDPRADFTQAEQIAERVIGQVLSQRPPTPMCWNVNIPVMPDGEKVRGIRVCRQNNGYWREEFECRKDPHGRDYFWLHGGFFDLEPGATDTDNYALSEGYASVVPIQVDLTDYRQLDLAKGWFGE